MLPIEPSQAETLYALVAVVVLAFVHLSAGRFRFERRVPRSPWLSLAGGVSVAYVFVHLLPEVGEAAATIAHHGGAFAFAEHFGYLITLLGFVVFYGLELLARRETADTGRGEATDVAGLFWIHLGSFAVYNGMVGVLLLDRELGGLPAYVVVMALHFVVIDAGLRHHHGATYHRWGRWILAVAVLVGFACGYVLEDVEVLFAVFVPFLSGGVVLNAIKDELPADRESRFWAFAAGAVGYAALLLLFA